MFGNFENHCVRKYSKEVNGRYRNENESAWQERLEEKGEVSWKIYFLKSEIYLFTRAFSLS